ncbi:MAG: hypothetical protein QN194_14585 [Armatimonadota bacterium]|nr:hypothetical protein [Armatimonadota bacterium]
MALELYTVREQWLEHVDDPVVTRFVKEDMGSYGYAWWARAGREISRAYAEAGSGLRVLGALSPPVPTPTCPPSRRTG